MTTADIETAARAAYATYFGKRRDWEAERVTVQKHWLDAASRVLNGEVTNARHLRDAYLADWASLAWAELRLPDRKRWGDTLAAIQRSVQAVAA